MLLIEQIKFKTGIFILSEIEIYSHINCLLLFSSFHFTLYMLAMQIKFPTKRCHNPHGHKIIFLAVSAEV